MNCSRFPVSSHSFEFHGTFARDDKNEVVSDGLAVRRLDKTGDQVYIKYYSEGRPKHPTEKNTESTMCLAELNIYQRIQAAYAKTNIGEDKHPLFYELLGGCQIRGSYRPVLSYPLQRITETFINEDPRFDLLLKGNEQDLVEKFASMYAALHYLHVTVGALHCNISLEAIYVDAHNEFRLGDFQNCQNIENISSPNGGLRINPSLIPNGYETIEILTAKNNQYDSILTTVESDFYALVVAFIFMTTRIHPFIDTLSRRKPNGPVLGKTNNKFLILLYKLLKTKPLLSVDVLLRSRERDYTKNKKPFVDHLVLTFRKIGLEELVPQTSRRAKYLRKKKRCFDNSEETCLTNKRASANHFQLQRTLGADENEPNNESDPLDSYTANDSLSLSCGSSDADDGSRNEALSGENEFDDISTVTERPDNYFDNNSLQTPRPQILDEGIFIRPRLVSQRQVERNIEPEIPLGNHHYTLSETTTMNVTTDCSLLETCGDGSTEYIPSTHVPSDSSALAPHLLEAAQSYARHINERDIGGSANMSQSNEDLNDSASFLQEAPNNQFCGDILEKALASARKTLPEAQPPTVNEPEIPCHTSTGRDFQEANTPPLQINIQEHPNDTTGIRSLLAALPTFSLLAPEIAQKIELEYELHPDGSVVIVRHAVSRL
ncbi:hypothetical protein HDE_00872 [Halotydeus destructor]|nr:hypothetical protein HDE_00872 [Halotydeus destructor]